MLAFVPFLLGVASVTLDLVGPALVVSEPLPTFPPRRVLCTVASIRHQDIKIGGLNFWTFCTFTSTRLHAREEQVSYSCDIVDILYFRSTQQLLGDIYIIVTCVYDYLLQ
jgi:hypothetical protein